MEHGAKPRRSGSSLRDHRVEAEVGPVDPTKYAGGSGIIAQGAVEKILASGYVLSVYLEASDYVIAMATLADPATWMSTGYPLTAIDQPEVYFDGLETLDTLVYASGWDESLFARDWTADELKEKGVPAVFPDSFSPDF